MLQGAIILAIISPVLYAIVSAETDTIFSQNEIVLFVIGFLIWFVGFVFEVVGDYQLDQFIKNPTNKGSILHRGLWKYTRHPNYFGEATMWWGLWILTLPLIAGLGALTVIGTFIASPMLITLLLLKVSGVPMLEKAMETRAGWKEYAARTSIFIPWFPKL